MLESDAIARYYGLEKKQVVKFTYNSKITGSFVTYRCVIWVVARKILLKIS